MGKRKLPQTSLDAHKSLDPAKLSETYRKILFALGNIGSGTFEDIAAFLKVDKSIIWKRLSEMAALNLIYRPGTKKILKSGRMGYTWMILSTKGISTTDKELKSLKNKPTIQDHSRKIQAIGKQAKQQNLF